MTQQSPSTYLQYLPAFYSRPRPGDESLFIGEYLKVFEKLLSGIDDAQSNDPFVKQRKGIRELLATETIGDFFHPRLSYLFHGDAAALAEFIPSLPIESASQLQDADKKKLEQRLQMLGAYVGTEMDTGTRTEQWLRRFLEWLAGAVGGLAVDKNWTVDQIRFVIAQAMPLFRARGTAQGMEWLLNTWFGLDKDSPVFVPAPQGLHLIGVSVETPLFPLIWVCDSAGDERPAFCLSDNYVQGMPVVSDAAVWDGSADGDAYCGDIAWYFLVTLYLGFPPQPSIDILLLLANEEDRKTSSVLRDEVGNLLNEFKPALSRYEIRTAPTIWLGGGSSSTVGRSANQLRGDAMSEHPVQDLRTRLHYVPGMHLSADDMQTEQSYLLGKIASMNRILFKPGVIGGSDSLAVNASDTDPTSIEVSAGCAIDPGGLVLEFAGTRTSGCLKVKADPLPEGASEDSCYVYVGYLSRPDGDFRLIDDVQFVFTRAPQAQGVLLAKLMLEGERVVEVLDDFAHRDYAASRLPSIGGMGAG